MIRNIFSFLRIIPAFFIAFILVACGSSQKVSQNYLYFQEGANAVSVQQKESIIQPNDLLSIQVFSKTLNQQQAAIFNMHDSSSGGAQGYQVSATGTIEMPVIGSIEAAGLTKYQLQTLIMQKLVDYVRNPSVIVRFLQFSVNVLGEVRVPGTHKFLVDKVTIIDAISSAGDLTEFGRREDIAIIREENGKRYFYSVDLRSKAVFSSPVYLLQPNDIVYVSPNKTRLRSLGKNTETQQTIGVAFTAISVVTSLVSLFTLILK